MKNFSKCLICALALLLFGCQEEAAPPEVTQGPRPVAAVQVATSDFIGSRSFAGRARAEREVTLSFRVAGTLLERRVNVGDYVGAGSPVAIVDARPFEADVARLTADLAAAQADFAAKEEQYGRVLTLVESGTYSEARGDRSRGERDSAAARVASVQSALERAAIDLGDTVLKAPFDGRVVAAYAEDFEEIGPAEPIVRLLDLTKVEIVIDVPETMIAFVPHVNDVSVRFDAFPDIELIGAIEEIGSEASQTTRTYPVTVVMDQPEGAVILPGMSGRARARSISVPDPESGISVPASSVRALSSGSDEMAVWVVNPETNTVSLRPVVVGRVLSGGMQVTSGLEPGEWVVTAGTFSLQEGQEVRLPDDAEVQAQ